MKESVPPKNREKPENADLSVRTVCTTVQNDMCFLSSYRSFYEVTRLHILEAKFLMRSSYDSFWASSALMPVTQKEHWDVIVPFMNAGVF